MRKTKSKKCLYKYCCLQIDISYQKVDMQSNCNSLCSRKLYTYMSKLLAVNDSIMAIQEDIERESRLQLDLKIECQKALFDHKIFLKEQEQIRSERLQETYPEIVE